MPESTADTTTHRRRMPFVLIIISLFIGLAGLSRVMDTPQFESYRTVDVVQLVVSGAGFGVALTVLMFHVVRPRT